jgi:acylphosphatase
MAKDPLVRCEVVFRGHVQGVGFRYTTTIVAKYYPVTGYVMNARDGTVHMVAEGTKSSVSNMIRRLQDELGSYITDQTQSWQPATGEFQGFETRHEGP